VKAAGLAGVLATFGQAYLASKPLARGAARVWRAILACRTAILGGHVETCDHCGTTRHVYHSCRNRHCPQCQTRAKEAWVAARRREVLPVPYFHLVFTLPHDLNGLIAAAPRPLLRDAVLRGIGNAYRVRRQPATSGRRVGVLAGAAHVEAGSRPTCPSACAGGRWGAGGKRRMDLAEKGLPLPGARAVARLSRQVRRRTRGLAKRRALAGLVATPADWQRLKQRLHTHDWVVYAKQPLGGPEAVLEYLGRYTHRVAISNERILGIDGNDVLLRVRADPASGKKRTRCTCREPSSSTAFCNTSCRPVSSGSVTTVCSRRRAKRRLWRLLVRHSTCRHLRPRWSSRSPSSCSGSRASSRHAVRIAGSVSSGWSRPFCHNVILRSCGVLRDDRSRFRSSAAIARRCRSRCRSASQRAIAPANPVFTCAAAANRLSASLAAHQQASSWRAMACQAIDFGRTRLTIPISTALAAVQSNKVYLPRMRLRLARVLAARQINAIR
jgi:hypothetical protein